LVFCSISFPNRILSNGVSIPAMRNRPICPGPESEASLPGVIGFASSLAQLEGIILRGRATVERGSLAMPPEQRDLATVELSASPTM
jgi:hypothetical protein